MDQSQPQESAAVLMDVPLVEPVSGGIIDRASQSLGMSKEDLMLRLLHYQMTLPLDKENKESVVFVPCHTIGCNFGPVKSDVLVISKTPTQLEANQGLSQFGPNGDVWQPFLREKGLDIDKWLLYNIVPFKVPDYLLGKGELKKVFVNEAQCLLSLLLNLAEPKYILVMGSDALKGLYSLLDPKNKKVNFTSSRGCILELPNGAKAVCVNNPNAIIKAPEMRHEFEKDLELFVELVKTGGSSASAKTIDIDLVDTLEKLDTYCAKELDSPKTRYSLDLEWGANTTLRTIQLSTSKSSCAVLHISHEGLVPTELGKNFATVLDKLRKVLTRPGVTLTGHNLRGDIKILRSMGLDLMPQFLHGGFDTMIGYHMIPGNETLDKQLELVAIKMLNIPRYDKELRDWLSINCPTDEMKEKLGYGTVPDDILIPYGAWDAAVTYELSEVIPKLLAEYPKALSLYNDIIHPLNAPVLEMEEVGMKVDIERLISLTDLFANKVTELERGLQKQINWEPRIESVEKTVRGKRKIVPVEYDGFNPDSPDNVQEILFGRFKKDKEGKLKRKAPEGALILNLTPIKATDETPWTEVINAKKENLYNPSTDADVLSILGTKHPFAKALKDYKLMSQVTKNFLRPYTKLEDGSYVFDSGVGGTIGADGRYRSSFRIILETGRYATSPNCFPGYVEVLTDKGFRRFDQLTKTEKLAQFNVETKSIDFADPLAFTERNYNGNLLHIFTEKQIDFVCTPDHRCMLFSRTDNHIETTAQNYISDKKQYCAGMYVGGKLSFTSEQITLICALQADGSLQGYTNKKGNYVFSGIDFGFHKQRKIERLEEALIATQIPYKLYDRADGSKRFWVYREDVPTWLLDKKVFSDWILELDRRTLDFFVSEVNFWDGCYKNDSQYSSSIKENADWVQIAFALSGRRAKIREYSNEKTTCTNYQVDIIHRPYSWTTGFQVEQVPHNDKVYCVTMPQDTVIVRHNGKITITHQCQNFPKKQEGAFERIFTIDKVVDPRLKSIKSVMIADDDWVFIESDWNQAELWTMGCLSGDEVFLDVLSKSDLHTFMLKEAFGPLELDGKPIKEYEIDVLNKLRKKNKWLDGLRIGAKSVKYIGSSPQIMLQLFYYGTRHAELRCSSR